MYSQEAVMPHQKSKNLFGKTQKYVILNSFQDLSTDHLYTIKMLKQVQHDKNNQLFKQALRNYQKTKKQ